MRVRYCNGGVLAGLVWLAGAYQEEFVSSNQSVRICGSDDKSATGRFNVDQWDICITWNNHIANVAQERSCSSGTSAWRDAIPNI